MIVTPAHDVSSTVPSAGGTAIGHDTAVAAGRRQAATETTAALSSVAHMRANRGAQTRGQKI